MQQPARVLLVHGDPAVLQLLSRLPAGPDYVVALAATGREALTLARRQPPDLLFVAARLPDLDAPELCRQIKSDPALRSARVVSICDPAFAPDANRPAAEAGADECLPLPAGAEEWDARIRTRLRSAVPPVERADCCPAAPGLDARYRQLYESMRDAFVSVTLDGFIVESNHAYQEMLGYSAEELRRLTYQDLTPERWHAFEARIVAEQILPRGHSEVYEKEYRRKDGCLLPVELRTFLLRDAQCRPAGMWAIVRDITERKQVERTLRSLRAELEDRVRERTAQCEAANAALRAEEARLQIALEVAGMITWEWDVATGEIRCHQQAAASALGLEFSRYTRLEDFLRGLHPEDRDTVEQLAGRAAREGAPFECDYRLRLADGSWHQFHHKGRVTAWRRGKPARIVGASLDVSRSRQSEETLLRLGRAVEDSAEAVGMATTEGVHFYQNAAFTRLFGYTIQDLNEPLGPLRVYADPALGRTVFHTIMRGESWQGELEMIASDGRRFPVALRASAVKDDAGRVIGLIGIHTDLSGRRRTEQRQAAFAELAHRLSAADTRQQAAQIILETAASLLGADAGYLHLYDPDRDRVSPTIAFDTIEGRRQSVDLSTWATKPTPLVRRILADGARLYHRSGKQPSPVPLRRFGNFARRSACLLFVPVRSQGLPVGILSLQSYAPRAYSNDDLRLLQSLSDHCGDALRRIALTEAVRVAEARYRSLFDQATEGIVQSTPDGRLLNANAALARMLGYHSPDEMLRTVTDVARQLYANPARRQEMLRELQARGRVVDWETEVRRRDGGTLWVRLNAHLVRDANGRMLRVEGTAQDITARKQAELALRQSEHLQSSILNNIPDPAWIKGPDGRFLACNQALARFYGRKPPWIVGKTVFDLVPKEAARRFTHEDQTARVARRPVITEAPRTDPRGRQLWFETVKSAVLGPGGEVWGITGIARDITERRWAEQQLHHQRDLSLALSATTDAQAAAARLLAAVLQCQPVDCCGLYLLEGNEAVLRLAGQSGLPAALARRSWPLSRPPRARDAGSPPAGRIPARAMLREMRRHRLRHADALPIYDGRNLVGALLIATRRALALPAHTRHAIEAVAAQAGGALARIRIGQKLRANRLLLERVLHSLRAAVLVLDAKGRRILDGNPAACRLFGLSREELVGRTVACLHLDPAHRRRLRLKLAGTDPAAETFDDFEMSMRRKDRSWFPTEQRLTPLYDAAGRLTHWVYVIRDLARQKRAEQQLREASYRIIEAQEGERLRVARELHDGVNQSIAAAKLRLQHVESRLARTSPVLAEMIARSADLLASVLEESRRIAHNLRPADLVALGFPAACRRFARQFQDRTGLKVRCLVARGPLGLSPTVEANLYRILQEAFANVERHAPRHHRQPAPAARAPGRGLEHPGRWPGLRRACRARPPTAGGGSGSAQHP